jgi:hypothetical protein
MKLAMQPYCRSIDGNPRPAHTYRAARRNAARSSKAQVLKAFRLFMSPWTTLTQMPPDSQPVFDSWRHRDPEAFQHWWHEFLASELRPLAA